MQLPAFNFESASRATLKGESLPFGFIEGISVEVGEPLFSGGLRRRRCLTLDECRAACEQHR